MSIRGVIAQRGGGASRRGWDRYSSPRLAAGSPRARWRAGLDRSHPGTVLRRAARFQESPGPRGCLAARRLSTWTS